MLDEMFSKVVAESKTIEPPVILPTRQAPVEARQDTGEERRRRFLRTSAERLARLMDNEIGR